MYFTENRYDRSIESMMKGIPNFYPRGSGIVVTGRFEYTADMCDCRLCEHYGGKLRGCKDPRCVCLEERIAVGVASLKEVMKETMSEIKHYKLNVTSEGDGKDTEFNIALNKTYLAKSDFYASNVSYVIVTYSAVLNKYAVVGTTGNPNEDVELTYGNSSSVASVPGNTVYVYTYGVNVMKKNENGTALSGAKFSIYKTNDNAQNNQNAIGSGTSDSNGKVTFLNSAGEEVKLQSGTYYIVETQAPSGYNVYGKVIPITITATYRSAISNGTWVQNAPANGTASVTVTDTKLIVPQTGGYVMYLYIAGAASLVLGGVMLVIIKRCKKNSKYLRLRERFRKAISFKSSSPDLPL